MFWKLAYFHFNFYFLKKQQLNKHFTTPTKPTRNWTKRTIHSLFLELMQTKFISAAIAIFNDPQVISFNLEART